MAYFCCLVVEQAILGVKYCCLRQTVASCTIIFRKTRQLARGEGKIELTADVRCIRTSGKAARSTRPIVDLLLHRNVWKRGVARGKNVPQQKRVRIPCILLLYVKRAILKTKSQKAVVKINLDDCLSWP